MFVLCLYSSFKQLRLTSSLASAMCRLRFNVSSWHIRTLRNRLCLSVIVQSSLPMRLKATCTYGYYLLKWFIMKNYMSGKSFFFIYLSTTFVMARLSKHDQFSFENSSAICLTSFGTLLLICNWTLKLIVTVALRPFTRAKDVFPKKKFQKLILQIDSTISTIFNFPIILSLRHITNLLECMAMFYFVKWLSALRIITKPCADRILLRLWLPTSGAATASSPSPACMAAGAMPWARPLPVGWVVPVITGRL